MAFLFRPKWPRDLLKGGLYSLTIEYACPCTFAGIWKQSAHALSQLMKAATQIHLESTSALMLNICEQGGLSLF